MTNSTEKPVSQSADSSAKQTSPLRCLTGALIAGGMAIALYSLTVSIAQSFAAKPLPTTSTLVRNITVAVRTLVVGASALGTGVFALVAVGLVALGIQILIQSFANRSAPPSNS